MSALRAAAYLQGVIERAANLLPAQGPITAFVFLNTLQALEDLPFEEGVTKGARLFGCQPFLPESRYRDKLASGRIRREDLVGRPAQRVWRTAPTSASAPLVDPASVAAGDAAVSDPERAHAGIALVRRRNRRLSAASSVKRPRPYVAGSSRRLGIG